MIPEYTKAAIDRYVNDRLQPGGFLTAVLTNNLMDAHNRADDQNSAAMEDILKYVYWEIPSLAWGSEEKVAAWLRGDHLKED